VPRKLLRHQESSSDALRTIPQRVRKRTEQFGRDPPQRGRY